MNQVTYAWCALIGCAVRCAYMKFQIKNEKNFHRPVEPEKVAMQYQHRCTFRLVLFWLNAFMRKFAQHSADLPSLTHPTVRIVACFQSTVQHRPCRGLRIDQLLDHRNCAAEAFRHAGQWGGQMPPCPDAMHRTRRARISHAYRTVVMRTGHVRAGVTAMCGQQRNNGLYMKQAERETTDTERL